MNAKTGNHLPAPRRKLDRALALGGGLALIACLLAAMISAAAGRGESQWLGMEMEPLSPGLRAGLGLPPDQPGVYVSDVVGVAAQNGVREGDVIVAVNGRAVGNLASLREARRELPAGAPAQLTVNRQGTLVSVLLGSAPAPSPAALTPPVPLTPAPPLWAAGTPSARALAWGPVSRAAFGADLSSLEVAVSAGPTLGGASRGVLVNSLSPGGLAAQAGLQRGDLILHLGGYDVIDADQFWSSLAAQPLGSTVTLDVYRSGRLMQLSMTAGDGGLAQPAAWTPPCLRR
jgi:S1-C subfamily serine protease